MSNGFVVAIHSIRPRGDDVVHHGIARQAQGEVNVGPIIQPICSGGAEMRRSGDIGISLGGTYKRGSYVFAFISTEHAGNWESPTPSTSSPVYRYAAGRDLACAFLHIHNHGRHRSRAGQFI